MKTIWKYQLEAKDRQVINMPEDAQILSVQIQNGRPCLWALVDSSKRMVGRRLEIFGTGNPVSIDRNRSVFIGTYQIPDRALVFHVFENMEELNPTAAGT